MHGCRFLLIPEIFIFSSIQIMSMGNFISFIQKLGFVSSSKIKSIPELKFKESRLLKPEILSEFSSAISTEKHFSFMQIDFISLLELKKKNKTARKKMNSKNKILLFFINKIKRYIIKM